MKLAGLWANHITLFALILVGGISTETLAQDLTIFDSRRPISMTSKQTTYRDFYINGGVEHGVKRGMILTVSRRLTLYDTYRANSPKELMVEVGRVKIIHAQKGLSVARYYSEFSRVERATLESDFIMVGDKIDLSSAMMESQLKKKTAKKVKKPTTPKVAIVPQPAAPELSESKELASVAPKADQAVETQPVPMKSLQ